MEFLPTTKQLEILRALHSEGPLKPVMTGEKAGES